MIFFLNFLHKIHHVPASRLALIIVIAPSERVSGARYALNLHFEEASRIPRRLHFILRVEFSFVRFHFRWFSFSNCLPEGSISAWMVVATSNGRDSLYVAPYVIT